MASRSASVCTRRCRPASEKPATTAPARMPTMASTSSSSSRLKPSGSATAQGRAGIAYRSAYAKSAASSSPPSSPSAASDASSNEPPSLTYTKSLPHWSTGIFFK